MRQLKFDTESIDSLLCDIGKYRRGGYYAPVPDRPNHKNGK